VAAVRGEGGSRGGPEGEGRRKQSKAKRKPARIQKSELTVRSSEHPLLGEGGRAEPATSRCRQQKGIGHGRESNEAEHAWSGAVTSSEVARNGRHWKGDEERVANALVGRQRAPGGSPG